MPKKHWFQYMVEKYFRIFRVNMHMCAYVTNITMLFFCEVNHEHKL